MLEREISEWVIKNAKFHLPNTTFTDEELDHIVMCISHIDRWYREDWPLGDFLKAVVKNDLMEAFYRADDTNRKAMYLYCAFLHNELPGDWRKKGKA